MTKEEAIDLLDNLIGMVTDNQDSDYDEALKMAIDALKERPKGKWVYEKINCYTDRTYCSECGSHAPFEYVTDDHYGIHAHGEIRKTNFCPNCGADMRGEE